MMCRMSKSADRRERACDGSLAACPLQALKDAGRTAASVMWSPGCADLCQGPKRVRLKTGGPLRWGQTSQFYLQCSFVSMNSSMTTWSWGGFDWFWVTKITVQSWPLTPTECIVSLSALRVLRWGVAWRLRRPHQLIHWYILHGHFTAVTSVLVTLVYKWIDLISDQSFSCWLLSVFRCINVNVAGGGGGFCKHANVKIDVARGWYNNQLVMSGDIICGGFMGASMMPFYTLFFDWN